MVFKLLTVGDGDLSFSLAIKRAYPSISVTASTLLDSPAELIRTYSNSSNVIAEFQDRWKEKVVYRVDATKIEEQFSDHDLFDIILFNHPHLGSATLLESEEKHAKRHHQLLSHYFHSAKKVLKRDGVVHVCLCGSQPRTWNIQGAAVKNRLYCVMERSTDCPIGTWLFRDGDKPHKLADVESRYRSKRKFRNGKLGSKHFLSRYGYMHRRTEGELFRGNVREVNVQQSFNFIFAVLPGDDSTTNAVKEEMKCRICHSTFDSQEELGNHIKNPALPDVHTFSSSNEKVSALCSIKCNESPVPTRPSQEKCSFQPIDIDKATILTEAKVTKEFDLTRIKWLCRQSSFPLSEYIKSKKQCEDAIKRGRVFVNRQVALDTGRIVRENDTVILIEKYSHSNDIDTVITQDELRSGVKIIKRFGTSLSIAVVYKPVGVRCIGQFASGTLEMITKEYFESQLGLFNLHCLSKIDTGCAGLCVLTMSETEIGNSNLPKVVYGFTALVHGTPADWIAGTYLSVANSGSRHWKRQKIDADNDYDAAPVPMQTKLDLDDALFIRCMDTYCMPNGTRNNCISTLEIESSHDDGRLANTISFTLRKLGYPVVNDRFAKRETSALPRRMKNLLKQKICIGCFKVSISNGMDQSEVVSIEAHNRTKCSFWRDQLSVDKTAET